MTTYNREKYLDSAIKSVLASTYQNFELIIVDDGSSDRTVEIAQQYKKEDQRIKVYINENNLGDYPNRNKAASYAKGKYLKYVDADDCIYPYGLEQLVFYMEKFPEAGYGLCSLEQDRERIFPFQLTPAQAYERHYFETLLFHKAPLSSIIRKTAFDTIGGFTGKRMLGDFEMWHLLSQKYPVVLMHHGIVWYREHEEQEMADHRSDPMQPFRYLLLSEELLAGDDCPLDGQDRYKALYTAQKKIARNLFFVLRKHGLPEAIRLFRASPHGLIETMKHFFR